MNNGPWWKPAMALFGEVSTWIVVPIILALVVGKGLDKHYGTEPKLFLISTGAGFVITAFGMIRVVRRYMKDIQNIEDKENKNKENE